MNKIQVDNLSKRYGYQWIIKNFDFSFESPKIYAISGNNGSGKSTLIKLLSGYLSPSEGKINYIVNGSDCDVKNIFQHLSLAGPYTDLINEYTLREMFEFHFKFKNITGNIDFKNFEALIELPGQSQKTLQHFSSGMKQKIQLALALMSETPIVLLDEPTSFLDKSAKTWFSKLLASHKEDRLILIASNDGFDLDLCDAMVDLSK